MTEQFGPRELGELESMSSDDLAGVLVASDPVVALRALAEILLNGDDARLDTLLKDVDLRRHWQAYASDCGVDARDHEYARQLNTPSLGYECACNRPHPEMFGCGR